MHRWDDIFAIAEGALSQTCVSVGPVVYEQRRGVPIGGCMSKQCASILLGFCEGHWLTSGSSAHWCPPGLELERVVAATRYVDDLAMLSSVLCSSCVEIMVCQFYDKAVQFEAAKPRSLAHHGLIFGFCAHAHGVEHAWRSQALHGVVCRPTI